VTPRSLLLLAILAAVLAGVLIMPFVIHTRAFSSALRENEKKWTSLGSTNYEIVVASNSVSECTGGWNTIRIEGGEVVDAHNSEHADCSTDEFARLTVEALFSRIWEECIYHRSLTRPFPVCNVTYNQLLGYPSRLDTYTFTEDGEHLPSITVESVTLTP
jgi:Family of unknown function (DUF6174)